MVRPYYETEDISLYHGDAREILPGLQDRSVDMVLTDPPYLKGVNWPYEFLAIQAARVCKPGAFVYAYVGAEFLPHRLAQMVPPLTWFWLFNIRHTGGTPRMWSKKLMVLSKPVLALTVGPPDPGRVKWCATDHVSERADKRFHRWGQGVSFPRKHISLRTEPGELVVDPFMGSGNVAVACKEVGCRYIGIEIEERHCEAAAWRLAQEMLPLAGVAEGN